MSRFETFFASRKASGSTFGTVEGAHTPVPASFCEDLAAFLARLHSVDATGLTTAPVPPMRTAEEIGAAIDQMAAKALTATGTTSPRLAAVLACSDRRYLPERYRDADRAALMEQFALLKLRAGRR